MPGLGSEFGQLGLGWGLGLLGQRAGDGAWGCWGKGLGIGLGLGAAGAKGWAKGWGLGWGLGLLTFHDLL